MHLPLDYPRINQNPEWFSLDDDTDYLLVDYNKNLSEKFYGWELEDGIKIALEGDKACLIKIVEADWLELSIPFMLI